ncbi:hypothetical protein LCGC14_2043950 [marine sediment metagenome]|uniref:RNA ligase domain-containing protein n=1 Tax=marine sediment metagenome TaxID=412755 RepID=A0A0F9H4G4_9ZZZZ
MSELIVEVCKIDKIINHENANSLEIARVKGWDCIVKKDDYKAGDTIVFIPPDSLLPREQAERLGVINYLAGKQKNRVKTVKLRGEISYGLIISNEENWEVGTDVSEYYGIKKYFPPTRMQMGDMAPEDVYFMRMTSIENINNYPDTFKEGQIVAVTEKIDGCLDRLGISQVIFKEEDDYGNIEVYKLPSKEDDPIYGIWKAGSNKVNRKRPETSEEMVKHPYWFPYLLDSVYELIEFLIIDQEKSHVQLFGEVFGEGISGGSKSLHYGVNVGLDYRAFGLKINCRKVGYRAFKELCDTFKVKTVPEIAVIPYNFEEIKKLAKGKSVLAQEKGMDHIREGVVVCAYDELDGPVAKFMNPDYLLLKEKGKIADFTDE